MKPMFFGMENSTISIMKQGSSQTPNTGGKRQTLIIIYKGTLILSRGCVLFLYEIRQPTKLTEKQWLQVRTSNFKRWFGDWETVANAQYLLEGAPVAAISGNEFAKSDIDLVTQVTAFFESIGGKAERDGLRTVILDKEGAKSSISHGIGSKKAAAFAAVPDIIKNGIIIDHQQNWKGRGNETYVIAAPFKMGNDEYIGEVILTKREGDAKFYLHEVEIRGKLSDVLQDRPSPGSMDNSPGQAVNAKGTGIAHGSRLIIAKKLAEVKGKVSQVVDENGEPMLVYHGTDDLTIKVTKNGYSLLPPFEVFDVSSEGKENGAIFSADKEYASLHSNTGGTVAFFLNARNPIVQEGSTKNVPVGIDCIIRSISTGKGTPTIAIGEIIVFNPTQIKSATDNDGNFEPKNINKSQTGERKMSLNGYRFIITNEKLREIRKSETARREKLEYFRRKILEHLDKLEEEEDDDVKKALLVDDLFKKGGYEVGTVREWKDGRKYVKIAPGKWRPKYDSHDRGAKMAISAIKKKIVAAKDEHEMMQIVLEHGDRFSDAEGHPLPFVMELPYKNTMPRLLCGGSVFSIIIFLLLAYFFCYLYRIIIYYYFIR